MTGARRMAGGSMRHLLLLALAAAGLGAEPPSPLRGRASPQSATLSPLGSAGESWEVRCAADRPYPGMRLRPADGAWDLGDRLLVVARVANPGGTPLRVGLRLHKDGVDTGRDPVQAFALAPPGGECEVRLGLDPLVHPPFRCFGLRHRPPELGRSRPGGIDPAAVSEAEVFLPEQGPERSFRLLGLHAERDASRSVPPGVVATLPLFDRWGQYRHRTWPGKVAAEGDLAEARRREDGELARDPVPPGRDRWGGWADGPQLAASGRFRTERLDGRWWLVDPDGRLFWSQGVNCVNVADHTPVDGREDWWQEATWNDPAFADAVLRAERVLHGDYRGSTPLCFSPLRANLRRIDGDAWSGRAVARSLRRLRSWGFTTIGNWSDPAANAAREVPYTVGVHPRHPVLAGASGYWGRICDPFDPAFAPGVAQALAALGEAGDDPWCLGVFIDNELSWGRPGDLARWTLASPAAQPAKAALVAALRRRHGAIAALNAAWGTALASWDDLLPATATTPGAGAQADLLAFGEDFREAYFAACRAAVRARNPAWLYLGCRANEQDPALLASMARHCDVISLNIYRELPSAFFPAGIPGDRPLLVTEFHVGVRDRGLPQGGLLAAADADARAAAFTAYVRDALDHPALVGSHWFAWYDQSPSGRYLDGENYAVGLVDVTDRPHDALVAAARLLAQEMYPRHAGARPPAPARP